MADSYNVAAMQQEIKRLKMQLMIKGGAEAEAIKAQIAQLQKQVDAVTAFASVF